MLFSISKAQYIYVSVRPHESFGEVRVRYELVNGSDVLQVFLVRCSITDEGISCPYYHDTCPGELLWEERISGEGEFSMYLDEEPGMYKICGRLKNTGKYDYVDGYSGEDNYLLLKNYVEKVITRTRTKIVERNVTKIVREPEIEILEMPTALKQYQPFNVTYLISNPTEKPINAKVYSFSYHNGSHVTRSKPWDYHLVHVGANATFVGRLSNEFLKQGRFLFKVRMRVNDTRYTDSLWVNVSCYNKPSHKFIFKEGVVGVLLENQGTCNESYEVIFNSRERKVRLSPNSSEEVLFNRTAGYLVVSYRGITESRRVYPRREVTGAFAIGEKDLSRALIVFSALVLLYVVWRT
ncbi:hypothetical protein DRN62_00355 [Nanoarchaeota archaeon]|nr:MAG: hypothetical protein DRN62_00355 [Nanoarchaeota archaeon]